MRVERDITTVDGPEVVGPPPEIRSNLDELELSRRPAHVERTVVASDTTIMPAAVAAGIAAVAPLVLGGVFVARAGLDGPFDEPVVTVAGFTGTALLGIFLALAGFALLCSALGRSRSAIQFCAVVIGVLASVAVIEPSVRNGALALERGLAAILVVGAVVLLVITALPTVHRTATHVEGP